MIQMCYNYNYVLLLFNLMTLDTNTRYLETLLHLELSISSIFSL